MILLWRQFHLKPSSYKFFLKGKIVKTLFLGSGKGEARAGFWFPREISLFMYVDCAGSMEEDMEFVSKNQWVQVVGLFRRSFFRQWAFLKVIKNIKFNE